MSTPVAEAAIAAHPEFLYLFRADLPPRPPTPEELAAYGHRYEFPEWRPVRALAEEGAALAQGIIAAPRPDDSPEQPGEPSAAAEPATQRFTDARDAGDRLDDTAVIPADDMPTCLIPEVPA